MKATLTGEVKGGTSYHYFVPFKANIIFQHSGLYIFHILSKSPRVDINFIPQYFGKSHVNQFIHRSFRNNS